MTPSAAGARDGGITLLQLLVAVTAVLAATTALTSHPAARSLRRVAPRPRARVMAGGNMTVGWRDTHNLDRLGDESPEDERLLSLLDSGLRGFSSNMGWLPADERRDLPPKHHPLAHHQNSCRTAVCRSHIQRSMACAEASGRFYLESAAHGSWHIRTSAGFAQGGGARSHRPGGTHVRLFEDADVRKAAAGQGDRLLRPAVLGTPAELLPRAQHAQKRRPVQ